MRNHISVKKRPVWLVTGGAGFIGSNFVTWARKNALAVIVNLDKLTYSGCLDNLKALQDDPEHLFVKGDIGDTQLVRRLFREYTPQAVIHFAAESHVDRSILGPKEFVQTNVLGTFHLLTEVFSFWEELEKHARKAFRFLHISTDEVFGSLDPDGLPFTEKTAYAPNSPYAASKAASDHFVRAYHHTYGLPTITTHTCNNYGPYQFPEKLIPLMILSALDGKPLPVYGDGLHVRDWIHVHDHCRALYRVLERGEIGATYNIGGRCEVNNLELIHKICSLLDEIKPAPSGISFASLIRLVKDRPGHDRRYAIDNKKIMQELDWKPEVAFEDGLRKTICWYLEHRTWIDHVRNSSYEAWIRENYEQRKEETLKGCA